MTGGGAPQLEPYAYPQQMPSQNTNGYYNGPQITGAPAQNNAGYQNYASYPPQEPQLTGHSVSQQPTGVEQQPTGPSSPQAQAQQPFQNYQPTGSEPQQSRPFQNYQPTGSEAPQSRPFQNYQPTGSNVEPEQARPFQNYQPTGQLQPSEPNFDGDDYDEEDIKQSVPQFKLNQDQQQQNKVLAMMYWVLILFILQPMFCQQHLILEVILKRIMLQYHYHIIHHQKICQINYHQNNTL